MKHYAIAQAAVLALWALAGPRCAAADQPDPFERPEYASADEPLAKTLSLPKAAAFLDAAAVSWTRERECGTCHTNFPYLLARPALKDIASNGPDLVRAFFEERVRGWDGEKKRDRPRNDTEVVATAATLALNDARTTGRLSPRTGQALDRMWKLQRADGAWDWEKCTWPPLEDDDYFGAVYAALGVGNAPEGYARREGTQAGLEKLRTYFRKNSAPTLHHKAWLLWASLRLDGLMTVAEREQTIKDLLALQRADGGWSLPSLGDWKGFDGRANDPTAPSDGYGTGLVVYVLRQAGVAATDRALQRGIGWLKTHQRVSGRWFTRSLNTDRAHYISNAGTAFAVLALEACGEASGRSP